MRSRLTLVAEVATVGVSAVVCLCVCAWHVPRPRVCPVGDVTVLLSLLVSFSSYPLDATTRATLSPPSLYLTLEAALRTVPAPLQQRPGGSNPSCLNHRN